MRVIRASVLGFCMGVRRAVDCALAEAARSERVCTLGPLIHNPRVLTELQSWGIETLAEAALYGDAPRELAGASVIIRAHGISPRSEARLRERGGRIVDATCPRVKASQLRAQALVADGYRLFLAGEAEHAEIIGIRGYAEAGQRDGDGSCIVVGCAAEAEEAAAALRAQSTGQVKTALIGQTTITAEEYRSTGLAITNYFPDLAIIETICAATSERQDALRALLDRVDAVIIAGGRESANTRRLLAIAGERGTPCALAESAAGIPAAFAAYRTVGISAGASTPDTVIDEIECALSALAPGG